MANTIRTIISSQNVKIPGRMDLIPEPLGTNGQIPGQSWTVGRYALGSFKCMDLVQSLSAYIATFFKGCTFSLKEIHQHFTFRLLSTKLAPEIQEGGLMGAHMCPLMLSVPSTPQNCYYKSTMIRWTLMMLINSWRLMYSHCIVNFFITHK